MCMRQEPALWTYLPLFFPPLSLLPTLLYFFLPKAPTQLIRVVSCMQPKGHTPPWTWRVCINQTYGLRRGSKSGCMDGAGNSGNQNAFSLLLLLLNCFSRVWICVTPEKAAHQAPLSLGFSRQEHWNGLPFSSPMHESGKWKWSCSVMSDSQRPHGLQRIRLLRPWDFPGKRTGMGCHCLLHLFARKEKWMVSWPRGDISGTGVIPRRSSWEDRWGLGRQCLGCCLRIFGLYHIAVCGAQRLEMGEDTETGAGATVGIHQAWNLVKLCSHFSKNTSFVGCVSSGCCDNMPQTGWLK